MESKPLIETDVKLDNLLFINNLESVYSTFDDDEEENKIEQEPPK